VWERQQLVGNLLYIWRKRHVNINNNGVYQCYLLKMSVLYEIQFLYSGKEMYDDRSRCLSSCSHRSTCYSWKTGSSFVISLFFLFLNTLHFYEHRFFTLYKTMFVRHLYVFLVGGCSCIWE
jgi:hypothetical protein